MDKIGKWTPVPEIAGCGIAETEPFRDSRGGFQVFWESEWMGGGYAFHPMSACHSHNLGAGTLRGLHFQECPHGQAKLVTCVTGRIQDVVADVRRDSPTYRSWHGRQMSGGDGVVLYIPSGCAHGFVTLEPATTVAYMIEGAYRPEAGRVIRWNDPGLAIDWEVEAPHLSEKDRLAADWEW